MKRLVKMIGCLFCISAILGNSLIANAAPSQSDKDAYRAVFDADYYYNTYPDLAAAYGKNETALFNHFINHGILEGRSGNAEFNPQAYRRKYADLQAAYDDNMAAYCAHYIAHGKAEGRNCKTDYIAVNAAPASAPAEPASSSMQKIGAYTTYYNAKIPRATNVELAASQINGIVVQPGDSFSFCQSILPCTEENGYVPATIFVNKTKSIGIGGGICQVSSTLYAAMINAGLPATERHSHSLPVSYIPEGLDATVVRGALDLRFNSIYSRPLMIQTSAVNGALTVTLSLL